MRNTLMAALAFIVLLAPASAFAALSIDGNAANGIATGAAANTTVATSTNKLTNTNSGDVVVCISHAESVSAQTNPPNAPTSFSDTAGLTWNQIDNQTITGFNSSHSRTVWYWAYSSGILTNDVVTVVWGNNVTIDDMSLVCVSVTGFTGGPFTGGKVPFDHTYNTATDYASVTGATSTPTVTGQSSTNAATMALGMYSTAATSTVTAGAGYTIPTNGTANEGGGTNSSISSIEFQVFAATQTGVSVPFGNASNSWQMAVVWLTPAGSGGGGGSTAHNLMLMGVGQ